MPSSKLLVVNRTGVNQGELSQAVLKDVDWVLNEPGNLNFLMSQTDAKVTVPKLAENEIQLWVEDELEWWGVPWRCKGNSKQVEFQCEGLLSYFNRRFITNASQVFTSVDQFSIAFGLMTYAQSGADKNLNITNAAVSASGVTRSREYLREDHPNILTLLKEFPSLTRADTGLKNGFDFDIDITNGQRIFTPYHPNQGIRQGNLVLEFGRNVVDYEVEEDAVNLSNLAYCTGGSNGEVKFEENHRDAASALKYGEMQHIFSEGDQKDVAVLQQRAADHVRRFKAPIINPSLSAVSVPVNMLGVLHKGDTVPVRIKKGRHDIAGDFRIGGIKWNVRPNTLQLQFIEEVAA